MTVKNAIGYASAMEATAFSDRLLLQWVNQIEAEVQAKLLLIPTAEIIRYTESEMDKVLIAPKPFDKLYTEYLIWRIRQAQGEAERAENQKVIFEDAYFAYARSLCRKMDKSSPERGKDLSHDN